MNLPLGSLLLLQAIAGAPIYLIAGVMQGIFLHSHGQRLATVLATAVLTIALTLGASIWIWEHFFTYTRVFWGAVNLPALIATAVIVPLSTLLVWLGVSQYQRR